MCTFGRNAWEPTGIWLVMLKSRAETGSTWLNRGSTWLRLGSSSMPPKGPAGPCDNCGTVRECRYRRGVGEYAGKVACSARQCQIVFGMRDEDKERLAHQAKAQKSAPASELTELRAGSTGAFDILPQPCLTLPSPLPPPSPTPHPPPPTAPILLYGLVPPPPPPAVLLSLPPPTPPTPPTPRFFGPLLPELQPQSPQPQTPAPQPPMLSEPPSQSNKRPRGACVSAHTPCGIHHHLKGAGLEAAQKHRKEYSEWVTKQNLVSGFTASSQVEDMSVEDCAHLIEHLANKVAECKEIGRKFLCPELNAACELAECPSSHEPCCERSDAIHRAGMYASCLSSV